MKIVTDIAVEELDGKHWKIYIDCNKDDYWVVCGKSILNAVNNFEKFSIYDCYIKTLYLKEAR